MIFVNRDTVFDGPPNRYNDGLIVIHDSNT